MIQMTDPFRTSARISEGPDLLEANMSLVAWIITKTMQGSVAVQNSTATLGVSVQFVFCRK
ncbi:MAG: hypothetical protein JWN45_3074 [Acidobacteriaceae bacterium]|nr:hypothetical protein [Acidobacteriaceae bacterium]